jgi:hypothetical protein
MLTQNLSLLYIDRGSNTEFRKPGRGDLVGTLTDPIIVYPGGWGDSLPEWLKNAIVLERLAENIKASKGEQPMGTDAESCAYLNTASLTAPMDNDWSQIYLYMAGKTYSRWHRSEMPDDIRVDSVNDPGSRIYPGRLPAPVAAVIIIYKGILCCFLLIPELLLVQEHW